MGSPCDGVVRGCSACVGCVCVSAMAQVELKGERV
jgi:hypothetical protein